MRESVKKVCPHCNTYVQLTDEKVPQICPNCGKKIGPCSICSARTLCLQSQGGLAGAD